MFGGAAGVPGETITNHAGKVRQTAYGQLDDVLRVAEGYTCQEFRFFSKYFLYLFMRDTVRERERQRHRQREKQDP